MQITRFSGHACRALIASLDRSDSSEPKAYSNNATSIAKHNFGLAVRSELVAGTLRLTTSAQINPLLYSSGKPRKALNLLTSTGAAHRSVIYVLP